MAKSEPHRRGTRQTSGARSKYTVIQKIASGGMAEIYVAKVSGLAGSDRLCVLKKILPIAAENPKAIQMFLDEARIAATLQHENIVQMFEVGSMGRDYFIAMEYLHGEDVRMILKTLHERDERLPLQHALHIVVGMCSGLHYAHDQSDIHGKPLNIVHRDISPHNLFVTYDGGVKVLDFGIALAANRNHHTRIDTLKGKVSYMSPEQCHRLDLDRRSDVYAAGIVLFELTTGLKLNPGDDDFEIMKRTCDGPVPRPSDDVADYPKSLERIVMKALAKHPDDRYQTIAELQEAIEDFAHEERLRRSSMRLSNYMKELFSNRFNAWQKGMEQGASIQAMLLARNTASGAEFEIEAIGSGNSLEVVFDHDSTSDVPLPARLIDPGTPRQISAPRVGAFATFMALLAIAAVGAAAYFLVTRRDNSTDTTDTTDTAGGAAGGGTVQADAATGPGSPDAQVANAVSIALSIGSTPTGARIFIDDVEQPGRTPAVIENLEPGKHVVVLKRRGYADHTERLTIAAGEQPDLSVALEKPSGSSHSSAHSDDPEDPDDPDDDQAMVGTLKVTTSPTCKVFVDGNPAGNTALEVSLRTGTHSIRLVNEELEVDVTKTIKIYAGTVVSRHYTFERQ